MVCCCSQLSALNGSTSTTSGPSGSWSRSASASASVREARNWLSRYSSCRACAMAAR